MKLEAVRDIADAVLYEGYILYPYRPSSIKNCQRWTFGGLFPQAFTGKSGDASTMQIQTLVEGGAGTRLDVHVRFLHIVNREIFELATPSKTEPGPDAPDMILVARLEANGQDFLAWEEAVEREVAVPGLRLDDLVLSPHVQQFGFDGARQSEGIKGDDGNFVGAVIRSSFSIEGHASIAAERLAESLFRLTINLENLTALPETARADRTRAQARAFASTHCIVTTQDGAFVSLFDPPEDFRDAVAACENKGFWPVLVGSAERRDAILASPIILYDFPRVAPESPGDLYDGTEIDEILSLRILAMSDAEKREMAAVDARARALLERTHKLSPESFARLHGAMRPPVPEFSTLPDALEARPAPGPGPRLAALLHGGREIAIGARVRLRPKAGGDILDIALKDKLAIIQSIERDFEDRVHVAVTILEDPGRDLGAAGYPGHRFFFSPEEIEPLANNALDGGAPT